ncbi:hypothetical protein MKX03_032505 [Papaver bracteatum]|nr:hypothetical protein MKX03_032505 [Papaver bracteatum]
MTEVEKQMLLEKHRNAYRIRKAKIGCGNTAEISNQEFLHRFADLTLVPSAQISRDLQEAHVTTGEY